MPGTTRQPTHTTQLHVPRRWEVNVSLSVLSEHSTAQTRELACTKLVIPQVQSRGLSIIIIALGIEVIKVAHYIQAQVAKYVSDELGLVSTVVMFWEIIVQRHSKDGRSVCFFNMHDLFKSITHWGPCPYPLPIVTVVCPSWLSLS